jgi:hypothetical protein
MKRFRRLGNSKGANLIEAAIITPLLLLLTFAIVDFGSVFYVYLTLENGVSVGTRYAVTGQLADDPDNPGSKLDRQGTIMAATRKATPTLNLPDAAFSFQHMKPGAAGWSGGVGGPSDVERVTITYTWTFFTPLVGKFFDDGKLTVKVDSVMKNEARWQ